MWTVFDSHRFILWHIVNILPDARQRQKYFPTRMRAMFGELKHLSGLRTTIIVKLSSFSFSGVYIGGRVFIYVFSCCSTSEERAKKLKS